MKRLPSSLWFACGILASTAYADRHVSISAEAEATYSKAKYESGDTPKRETYVVMRGRYHAGATADRSIDGMPFRQILSYLTPKLARQEYVPAASLDSADLLLVVHWGVTNPRVGTMEMMARSSATTDTSNTGAAMMKAEIATQARDAGMQVGAFLPDSGTLAGMMSSNFNEATEQLWMDDLDHESEQLANERSHRDLGALLGYSRSLRQYRNKISSPTEEATLRSDLSSERYFIIVRAYEMRPAKKQSPPRPVWTINLNISSPGNNFRTAMEHMSTASIAFVGRTTENVTTIKPKQLEAKVELGEPILLGEVR